MDFTPSASQQLLVATARDVLRRHCPPETAQRLALDAHGFDETLWRRMAELGWSGLLVPGDLGGSDGTLLDVILLVEEMGRAALPGPFVTSAVVATTLLLAGRGERGRRLLPALASGERIATLEVMRTYPADYRVVLVGDATMSPYELVEVGGANEHWNDEPGVKWLARLCHTWRRTAWLNPQPEEWWEGYQSIQIVRRLLEDRMYPLTLAGLDGAIRALR